MSDSRIVAFIRSYTRANGYPPTLSEIAADSGISVTGVRKKLRQLEADGRVETTPGTRRTVRLRRGNTKTDGTPM